MGTPKGRFWRQGAELRWYHGSLIRPLRFYPAAEDFFLPPGMLKTGKQVSVYKEKESRK